MGSPMAPGIRLSESHSWKAARSLRKRGKAAKRAKETVTIGTIDKMVVKDRLAAISLIRLTLARSRRYLKKSRKESL